MLAQIINPRLVANTRLNAFQRSEEMAEKREMHGIKIKLTDEQKKQIEKFWKDTGSVGRVEILVDVVNDKISPASIQVGTAK